MKKMQKHASQGTTAPLDAAYKKINKTYHLSRT